MRPDVVCLEALSTLFILYITISLQVMYLVGCAIALLFAASRALYLVLGRKWSRDATSRGEKPDTIVTVFYPSMLGVIFTSVIMLCVGDTFQLPAEPYGICSLFSVGILSSLGLMCLMLSLKTLPPSVVSVIRNLEIIWAFVLQFLVLEVIPSWWSVGGGVVIVFASVAASFREKIEAALKKTSKEVSLLDETPKVPLLDESDE